MTEPDTATEPVPEVSRDVIAALLGRTLSDDEWARAQTLLGLLWSSALDGKPCSEAYVKPTAVGALAEVVAEILRNPGRYASESEGEYSYSRPTTVTAWSLAVDSGVLARIWGGCPGSDDIFMIGTGIRRWP